ncbi:MAG TPA: hypothetical protein VGG46_12010 [Terriglobales bacterium]|jgi:hypothetical protein
MALWKPDNIVGSAERIGRRFFERKPLVGARGQISRPHKYDISYFQDSRGSISFDRLGAQSVDGKVLKYLNPLAREAASKLTPKATFIGWAYATAKELQEPNDGGGIVIEPSPIAEDAAQGIRENVYHAHAVTTLQDYWLALHLRQIFERHNKFQTAANAPHVGLLRHIRNFATRKLKGKFGNKNRSG